MEHLGINVNVKSVPELDPKYIPLHKFNAAFLKGAKKPLGIAVERAGGEVAVLRTFIHGTPGFEAADKYYADRMVKTMLWLYGGWKVYISGDEGIYEYIRAAYTPEGSRAFDQDFMAGVYERPFEVVSCAELPAEKSNPQAIGRHLDGCRIGFDAGGSDRKVSAVIDGQTVYSEEVVWHPKTSEDLSYQYDGIVSAFKTAASKLPRVDGIGVSSAGTFVGNSPMVSSLFLKIPRAQREQVKSIYDRAAKEIGDVPIVVANDGDVTALAGAMSLQDGCVMGLAMGTSEAAGYIDRNGDLLGWFNELAFAPVDLSETAAVDEWSGDRGVGCKYFSQDAVIKLAPAASIALDEGLSPAEKLKTVQALAEGGDERAKDIFRTIGADLAHTVPLYEMTYDIRHLIVLGRVASGVGGELIVDECCRILQEEYPALAQKVQVMLPDEKFRRVGQSMAAASLPEVPDAV